MSRKSKFWIYIRSGLEYVSFYGIISLLFEAYQYTWKTWIGVSLLLILCALHAHEVYRANNKEYFDELEKKRMKIENEKH